MPGGTSASTSTWAVAVPPTPPAVTSELSVIEPAAGAGVMLLIRMSMTVPSASLAETVREAAIPSTEFSVPPQTAMTGSFVGTTKAWPGVTAPNELVVGAFQEKTAYVGPAPVSWSDMPNASEPFSETPTSVLVSPLAGPPTATKVPSYDRNWTTAL